MKSDTSVFFARPAKGCESLRDSFTPRKRIPLDSLSDRRLSPQSFFEHGEAPIGELGDARPGCDSI